MIELDSVSKRYGDKEALTAVSLRVKPQRILALAGPSGSGKSTLLRLVAGLERPDLGIIAIDGRTVSTPKLTLPPRSRRVALIFQELALWPHMTVRGHLQFVLNACRAGSNGQTKAAVEELTAVVGLTPYLDRYPHQLSGGEQQRLAIARALAQRPSYLLMDEPFSNLDPLLKEELVAHIGKLVRQMDLGVVHVTHNISDLVQTAHDIAVLHRGQLLQAGERDAVYNAPRNALVKKLLGA